MFEREKPGPWARAVISIVILAVVLGGGYAAYRVGFAQGAVTAESGGFVIDDWSAHPMMNYHVYPHARGFHPGGNLIFGLIFILLLFGFIRRMVFGPRWVRWGSGPHGYHTHPGYPGCCCGGPGGEVKDRGDKVPGEEDNPK